MVQLYNNFYIDYCEKKVMVSPIINAQGNNFTVHFEDGDIKLKSEGFKRLLWVEKGKGATGLAYKLGKLIEGQAFCLIKNVSR